MMALFVWSVHSGINGAQLVGSRRRGRRVREWFMVVSAPLGGHVRVCIVRLCASGLRVDAVVRMVHGWGWVFLGSSTGTCPYEVCVSCFVSCVSMSGVRTCCCTDLLCKLNR